HYLIKLNPLKKIITYILFISVILTGIIEAQKTDHIRLKNGNTITGEIKSLNFGMLRYKTDGMSTIDVKWDHVTQIKSKYKFEVTLDKGGVYLAYLDTTSNINEIDLIINSKVSFIVKPAEVVNISKIEDSFWEKFSGGFGFGLNYSKGSDILTYDLSGDLHYRAFRHDASLKISSNLTDDKNINHQTKKNNAELKYSRHLPKHWFYTAFTTAEQNSQLGLDLRTSLGAGFGHRLLYSYKNTLQLSLNLVGNREWPTDGEERNNLEGLIYLEYRIFNNASPKTKLISYLALYPSLTDKNRVRTNFEVEGSIEIWSDFEYKLKYYYNLDNKPATEGAEKKDWGIITSVGYSFN
ncbi:MAG: DUF481 domain-containing protein, partial [Bacteroidota bacterium]